MLEGALGASGRQLSSKGLEAGMERLGLKGGDFVGDGEDLLHCFDC